MADPLAHDDPPPTDDGSTVGGGPPSDPRVICNRCVGKGEIVVGGEREDCPACKGVGLVDPTPLPTPRQARVEPESEEEAEEEEAPPPPPKRRGRPPKDLGFDVQEGGAVAAAPRQRRQRADSKVCRDPDCPDHAGKATSARKCVETGRMIYPRMSNDAAANLAGGLLTLISTGVSLLADKPIAGPTSKEKADMGPVVAALVQRYLGSLGAHSDLFVFATLLFAYGRLRLAQAQAPALPKVTEIRPAPHPVAAE